MSNGGARRHFASGTPWEERTGHSRAVRVGDRVWVSGITGTHGDGGVPDDAMSQARVALRTIEGVLAEVGATMADIVSARVYITREADWDVVAAALRERLGEASPAMTVAQVTRLASEEHVVQIEVEAVAGSGQTG